MINLVSSFYASASGKHFEARNSELKQTLINNLTCEVVEKIHLFVDDQYSLSVLTELAKPFISKIEIIRIGIQPLYGELFEYANSKLKGKICMICNSDIYVHEVDARLFNHLTDQEVFSLTRYEHDLTCPLIQNYQGSHDCFIFKTSFSKSFIQNINFKQNVWGSENVVLYELKKDGKIIYNPCHQFKIVHLHQSNMREEGRERINKGKNPRSYSSKPVVLPI